MRRLFSVFFIFCFIFLALAGCDSLNFLKPKETKKEAGGAAAAQAPVKGPVVAKVNNLAITLEDLNQEVEAYNTMVPPEKPELKITTREQKIKYLKDEMVRRGLMYQEALDQGLDRDKDVLDVLERNKRDILVVELAKRETEKVDVGSAEIEEYYNTYKEQLKDPEERQIREIMVPSEQEAKDIVIQLLQGSDFAALAQGKSQAPSAKNGGDLGLISKGQKFSQFDEAAFSDTLEPGRISNIFKGPDGYYILKLEAKRGGKQRSLSEMWEDIKRGLTFIKQQQKIEDLISKISRDPRFKVEIYEGEVK